MAKTIEEKKVKEIEVLMKKAPEKLAATICELRESLRIADYRIEEETRRRAEAEEKVRNLEEETAALKAVLEQCSPKKHNLIISYYGPNCDGCAGCYDDIDPDGENDCNCDDITETASFYTFRITPDKVSGVLTDFTHEEFSVPAKVVDADTGAVLYEAGEESDA